jgi:plasmid replication initiation protein
MDKNKRGMKRTLTVNSKSEITLKKHVGLIHCENKLSLIQRKICNILLFNALEKINEQDIHVIALRQLCSLVGYNSNDSKLIKESIKSLISVVMEWNLLEDSKFLNEENYPAETITWNASALLAGASIKNGIIHYSYSPQIKSVLSSLEIYGRINLFVQAKFNSTYSLVLYENCVRFKNIKQTSWFTIELFRSLMGVSSDKYPSFKEFKRNVINVAIKEVNQKSDIYLEPQFKKLGRNISAVQFLISENENYQPTFRKKPRVDTTTSTSQQLSLMDVLLSEYNLSGKQANEIISGYSQEYIIQKINLVKAKKNIDHPGAYLIAALKNDYKEKESKVGKMASRAARSVETSYLREARQASEITPLKNKYMTYKLKIYTEFIQQQAEHIQNTIKEKFEQLLKPNTEVLRFYKKSGLASPFVMADFIGFIDKYFPHLVGEYLSFEDYITSEE